MTQAIEAPIPSGTWHVAEPWHITEIAPHSDGYQVRCIPCGVVSEGHAQHLDAFTSAFMHDAEFSGSMERLVNG